MIFFLLLGCMHGSRKLKQNPLPNGETKKIVIKDEVGNTIVYSIRKCSGSPPPLPLLVEDCSCGQDDSLTLIHNVRNEDKSEMVNKKSETALLSFWVAGWNSFKIISVVFSVSKMAAFIILYLLPLKDLCIISWHLAFQVKVSITFCISSFWWCNRLPCPEHASLPVS